MDNEIKKIIEDEAMTLRNKVVAKIYEGGGIPPANAPSTIEKKGSSHTLIDHGDLATSIDYRVEDLSTGSIVAEVGVFDEGVAEYAAANEFGVIWSHRPNVRNDAENREEAEMREWFIPPRSFLASTYDENIESIVQAIGQKFDIYARTKWNRK